MLLEKKIFALSALTLLAVFCIDPPKINIDKDLASVRIEMVSQRFSGSLQILETNIAFDPLKLEESYVEVTLSSESLNTGNLIRDIRLGSKKYLARKKHPLITFKSKHIKDVYNGYLITGDLTIKEVTQEVIFDTGYRNGSIIGAGSLNLEDFKMPMSEKRYENKLDIYFDFPLVNPQ